MKYDFYDIHIYFIYVNFSLSSVNPTTIFHIQCTQRIQYRVRRPLIVLMTTEWAVKLWICYQNAGQERDVLK